MQLPSSANHAENPKMPVLGRLTTKYTKGTKTNHGWTPMDTDFGGVVDRGENPKKDGLRAINGEIHKRRENQPRKTWIFPEKSPIRVHPCPSVVENGRKWPVFAENRDFWPKTAKNGIFRLFFTIFHLRGPLRLVSVDDFLSEA